eukprot:scaffold170771_cov20-Tisochrysis_lutea.AAC.1
MAAWSACAPQGGTKLHPGQEALKPPQRESEARWCHANILQPTPSQALVTWAGSGVRFRVFIPGWVNLHSVIAPAWHGVHWHSVAALGSWRNQGFESGGGGLGQRAQGSGAPQALCQTWPARLAPRPAAGVSEGWYSGLMVNNAGRPALAAGMRKPVSMHGNGSDCMD